MKRLQLLALSALTASLSAPLFAHEEAQVDVSQYLNGMDFSSEEEGFSDEAERFKLFLEQLQSQLPEEVQREVEAHQEKMKELGEKYTQLEAQIADYEVLKSTQKDEIGDLEDRLVDQAGERARLAEKIEQLEAMIAGLNENEQVAFNAELEQKKNDLMSLDDHIVSAKRTVAEKRAERAATKEKIAATQAELATLQAEMERFNEDHIDFGGLWGEEDASQGAVQDLSLDDVFASLNEEAESLPEQEQ